MIDIPRTMTALARKRPVFHSEADFQHALAWELHSLLPDLDVRLELPLRISGRDVHLDLFLVSATQSVAIELKYKTRGLLVNIGGESFSLKNQSAQDLGRYDFLKDVQRIERIVESRPGTSGFTIMLTNDSSYWKRPNSPNSVDAAFRINEGQSVSGNLTWDPRAAPGTIRSREGPIVLVGRYTARWQDYSEVVSSSYGQFRFLVWHTANVVAA